MACNYNYTLGSSYPAGMIAGVSCVTCPTNGAIIAACGEYCDPITVTAGNTYAILIDNYTSTLNTGLDFAFGPGMTAQIAPNTAFTISPSGITCGSNVTITINNTSLGVPDWDFGNGNSFSGMNPPAQVYTADGSYTVSLTMGDATKEVAWRRLGFEPRFGMDEMDTFRLLVEAEKLAKELENENLR